MDDNDEQNNSNDNGDGDDIENEENDVEPVRTSLLHFSLTFNNTYSQSLAPSFSTTWTIVTGYLARFSSGLKGGWS